MLRGQRFENDVVVLFINHRPRPFVDFEIFSEPPGNHHLPFYGE